MDFYRIKENFNKGTIVIAPDFIVGKSKDLMIRGKSFYAVWNEEKGLWSTDEFDIPIIIDKELYSYADGMNVNSPVVIKNLSDFSSRTWVDFKKYIGSLSDNSHQLDNKITFSNTEVTKKDYISRRLSYPLEEGDYSSWDKLVGTLYTPEEKLKIEWAIGAIISGDSKSIQKFLVLYGEAGAGKSTILNIIQKLFDGYYTIFEAKALTSSNNTFSTEVFKTNPLVAIQHDGDLSRIEDNTKLNSIVSHEEIVINEKYKAGYSMKVNCFLFMATNKPVKITDGKSGLIRRLIDVKPSGRKVTNKEYNALMKEIDYHLGAIAMHCLEVYEKMGKNYYNAYRPVDMMYKTDPFYNFVEDNYDIFKQEDGTTLKAAYAMYKQYCDETNADYKLQMYKFREELKNYFEEFRDTYRLDGIFVRSYYKGFMIDKFERMDISNANKETEEDILKLTSTVSLLDKELENYPAQLTNDAGVPRYSWDKCKTKLKDIDTRELHYVLLPLNHIVIDFDIPDSDGNKNLELNLKAASKWPKTYAELSKSGYGVHLHYYYAGDVNDLSRIFSEHIEIKIFSGKSSLRRKLTYCNDIPIATISSGLPLKNKGDKMVNAKTVKSEKSLINLIRRNLNKEIMPGTKPSIDFIFKILDDAYNSGLVYDISVMKPEVLAFAMKSTHQAEYCVKKVGEMKFKSENENLNIDKEDDRPIVFFDTEVFPNLLLVNWKIEGEGNPVIRMINPSSSAIEDLLKMKLVGFNNRRYDNHILYARLLNYTNEQIFNISQRIVNGYNDGFFGEAYNLSYADIYDFSSVKQSLKKFEIELGIHHQELGMPWDKPVPEDQWEKVAEYCDNDVIATEAVFNYRKQDFVARKILSALSGLSINDTTRAHVTKIIFQGDKHPELVYTDLNEIFPGYSFIGGKSEYMGEDPGEGGYVYAEPGMYGKVALLDIASMHPTSIEELNLFGKYTRNFSDIKAARIFIKHHEYDEAKMLLNGALAPFLVNENDADSLASALKIVINSVYGYTTATFDNPFKDPRNVDNIVAKRGALFMINLKHEVQKKGYTVAHIKTDSIKIPDADDDIINFVMEYGKQYGYNFELEAIYEKMCLVNDAVYIARYSDSDVNGKHKNEWTATGKQFQVPFVFKTLFSHEKIMFEDFCETKTTQSALYLDFNENNEEEHRYTFIGKVGSFCPVLPGCGGGLLLREQDGKYYFAAGSKGYRWKEAEVISKLSYEDQIDISYYRKMADEAIDTISKYGDYEWFVSELKYSEPPFKGSKII